MLKSLLHLLELQQLLLELQLDLPELQLLLLELQLHLPELQQHWSFCRAHELHESQRFLPVNSL